LEAFKEFEELIAKITSHIICPGILYQPLSNKYYMEKVDAKITRQRAD